MSAPLIAFKQIQKSFGAVRALRGVDFDVHPGEVHALLGENGAGKSTLIKIATGAYQPDHGTMEFEGVTHRAFTPGVARALGIACIYQQPALFPDLSVMENIALRLESSGAWSRVDWKQRRAAAVDLLQRVGATLSPDVEVRALSMPEQQLVEIACAIGAGAKVVIMDEPTASLTQREQERLWSIVRDLRTSGVGVVYITHRLEEVFALADRVTVLRDGESIGTYPAQGMNEATLIRLMVGREITQLYPPSRGGIGKTMLGLAGVGCRTSGVSDVSFEVKAGEVFGLAGLVGAGRTELARVLFGLTPADGGEIFVDDERRTIRSPAEAIALGIGYVPEDRRHHGVILEMPVGENVTMAIHDRIFPGTWLQLTAERQLAAEFIAKLEIKTAGAHEPAGQLSGGNQQKVSLARWLATKPRILILDEPTQGVDVGAKSEIHRVIRALAEAGLAVVLISSDLPEIIGMSDRIGVMKGGRLVTILPGNSAAAAVMAAALGHEQERQSP
jgi:rhamnose transport system ATP-binding protein